MKGYYVKLLEITKYFEKNKLDKFTYNKTLQKVIESLKVDPETKRIIKSRKR